jgi:dipeptidyl aminopeptidase/acylaminoacyl peptidase
MPSKSRACAFGAVLFSLAPAAFAEPPPLQDFLRHAQFLDVKISPTGEYLAAAVMASEDTGALVILRRSDLKMTGSFKLRGRTLVDYFEWANDERIVFSVQEKQGSKDNPSGTGEVYATNWDGSRQELLLGPRARSSTESARLKDRIEAAAPVDMLHDDDKNILVQVYPVGNEEGTYPKLERLNIYTGSRSVLARAPVLNADFVTDRDGQVRFAVGNTVQGATQTWYRADNNQRFELLNDDSASGIALYPAAFSTDGKRALLFSEEASGPDSVVEWDPASGERKVVARDDNVDPLGLLMTHDGDRAFGVAYMDGLPRIQIFDAAAPDARILKSLQASFPGQWVSITSHTKDGSELVFRVSSDRNPGEYYLLDRDRKATFLLATREWIDPEKMASMKPVSYTARDGLVIQGYLTLPPGSDGKDLPLIIHPHGGPFGPFDRWTFNPEVQLLASRGYAVLQPNFRGSGNHGRAFERMGYRQWGGTMQDDLTDATRWAIEQGIADPKRICIYGASYGGYASAMGVAKEPDLYRCAVGYVGLYDLALWYREGDVKDSDYGVNYLKTAVGSDPKALATASPAKLADRIKAPIFIAVGGEDERCPPEQSEALKRALEAKGRSFEWMLAADEGHGFYKLANNLELYTRMLAFLDKHIGPQAGAASAGGSASP